MVTDVDGETEVSWMDKCKRLSDHVSVLERKLVAMENLQQLVKEKDEELRQVKSVVHQCRWTLLKSEHRLVKVAQIAGMEDGKRMNTDLMEACNSPIGSSITKDEKSEEMENFPEGVLHEDSEPVVLENCQLIQNRQCLPVFQTLNAELQKTSEPILCLKKSPVSKDLVDKLMQQNARLKKVLKDVLASRDAAVNSRLGLNETNTRQNQQSSELTGRNVQKKMKLCKGPKSYKNLDSQKSLHEEVIDLTEDSANFQGSTQSLPLSNRCSPRFERKHRICSHRQNSSL